MRLRWTPDDARAALTAYADSGLSVAAFAEREGLDPQRLYSWRRRFASDTAPAFVEVKTNAAERIEIVLRSGLVLRVPDSFEAESLRRLLDVLESSGSC
jgi:transposase-like protein